jgi:predicted N-acetyltransferase YhbS
LKIRAASPDEHEVLSKLASASKAHWGYTSEQLHHWASEFVFRPETISAWPTFVAETAGNVPVGVVQLNPSVEPWALDSLWVHPAAMGHGIGRRLVRQALEVARQAGQSEVTIDADPNAEGFYLSCGAKRIGESKAPIEGEQHRVRPQLRLQTREAI